VFVYLVGPLVLWKLAVVFIAVVVVVAIFEKDKEIL
jgi:hypothetical protein